MFENINCGCPLRADFVVNFVERPSSTKRFICQNGYDVFFSKPVMNLMDVCDCVFTATTLNGKPCDLLRFTDMQSEPLDFISSHWSAQAAKSCPTCGKDFVNPIGIWIGNYNEPMSGISVSEAKFRHVPHESTILLNVEAANKLVRNQVDVGLDPIYASDSEFALHHKQFLSILRGEENT